VHLTFSCDFCTTTNAFFTFVLFYTQRSRSRSNDWEKFITCQKSDLTRKMSFLRRLSWFKPVWKWIFGLKSRNRATPSETARHQRELLYNLLSDVLCEQWALLSCSLTASFALCLFVCFYNRGNDWLIDGDTADQALAVSALSEHILLPSGLLSKV